MPSHQPLEGMPCDNLAQLDSAQVDSKFGFWHLDIVSGRLDWSAGARSVFEIGQSEPTPTFDEFMIYVHPDDKAFIEDQVCRQLTTARVAVISYEYRIVTKTEKIKFLEHIGRHRLNADGTLAAIYGSIQDITERKAMEEQLRKSEERYRTLVENQGEGMGIVDRDERFTFANQAADRLFGVPPGCLIGRTLQDFVTADELMNLRRQTLLRGAGVKSTYVLSITRPDSEKRDLLVTAVPQYDGEKEFIGTMGVFRDITEQRKAEQALQESEEKHKTMIANIGDVIAIIGPDRTIQYKSPNIERWFGWKPEELIGKPSWETIHPDDVERLQQLFSVLRLTDSASVKFECRYRCKNGSYTWIECTAVNCMSNPAIKGILLNYHDISESIKTKEAIQLQNTALQSAANAVMITDRNGTIISVNRALTHLTGYSQEEAVGRSPSLFKSGRQSFTFYQNLWKTILAGKVWKGEIENKRKDGTIYTEEMTITPVRQSGGDISHFIGIKQDITEKKNLQQQIFQSQKVQSVGTLAGGIAHDFNNILGIILGYATMLEDRRIDPEQYDACIAVIIKNVERGAALVQQILTYARQKDVTSELLGIPDLIHEIVKMMEKTFPRTIIFSEQYAPELPCILGDRTQLHQALLNLCVNARDAMTDGGTIKLAAELYARDRMLARYPEAPDDQYICITVTDSGTGMDEAVRQRVFDPFFTTKEPGKGTGLGLSVVEGIVRSHHGFVDVESRRGEGTRFLVFLPAVRPVEKIEKKVRPAAADIRGGTETILVVEDEDFLMQLICRFLETKGYQFMTARDGEEAVELFARHRGRIDAVVSDIGLPKMNGAEAFNCLKEIDPSVKVILASGFFEQGVKEELERKGARGFIQKPYRMNEVLSALRRVLDEA